MTITSKDLKGLFNGVRNINGINIARVAWKANPWLIIENEETFEDAKKDDFTPIIYFKTSKELINYINNLKYQ